MSLFGQPQQSKPNLFGSLNTNLGGSTAPQQPSANFFGGSSSSQPQQNTASSLGGQAAQPSSLFGSSLQPPPQPQQSTASLFGSTSTQNQPQQQQQQQQQQQSGLFGQSQQQQQQQPQQQSSLFGSLQQPQQPQQQPQQPSSLFGQQPQPQQPSSLFGSTQQQPQPQQQGAFGSSLLDTSFARPQQQPPPQQQQQQIVPQQSQLLNRSLWQPESSIQPRQKTVPEQMQTLLEKWSSESANCVFQRYFYNQVAPSTLPYYGPSPNEDPNKWEEALAKKPTEDSVPVLCCGFSALGNRLRIQVECVRALQARLHEINGSLTAILQKHDLEISVKTADARRKHLALSRRCLTLATKIQILRNRGYAMDGAEEELKKRLLDLEKRAFDPALSARQEEIWAKMVSIRERAVFLQEETEKIAGRASGANGTNGSNGKADGDSIDEETLKMVRKILDDYDKQISHLQRELQESQKDFDGWEGEAQSDSQSLSNR